jgi:hypothetical protein
VRRPETADGFCHVSGHTAAFACIQAVYRAELDQIGLLLSEFRHALYLQRHVLQLSHGAFGVGCGITFSPLSLLCPLE